MILYSWNVNGFRAVEKKGFWDWFHKVQADVVVLQEVKAERDQVGRIDSKAPDYCIEWNSAKVKKGYSGTASFTKIQPLSTQFGLPGNSYQGEGRLIQLEFEEFYLFNIYFPNGQMSEERLAFKMGYYDAFLTYTQEMRQKKPIVVTGDFNTAHKEIDLKNPKANADRSGFLPQERAWIDTFIASGYVDTFRMFNQDPDHYTWWTYRFGARERNAGWRIDYFFVSEEIQEKVVRSWIEPQVMGSDHCPIGLEIDLK